MDGTDLVAQIERTDKGAMITTGRMIIANGLRILELPPDCSEGVILPQTIASFGLPPAPIMAVALEGTNDLMNGSWRMCVND